MPRAVKRARRSEISRALVWSMLTGFFPPPSITELGAPGTIDVVREAPYWDRLGALITEAWARYSPRTRPRCWWAHEAIEERDRHELEVDQLRRMRAMLPGEEEATAADTGAYRTVADAAADDVWAQWRGDIDAN